MYDYQSRIKETSFEEKCKLENKSLDELFIFAEGEENDKKTKQYEKFFQILSCLAISIKYYEHEKLSPGVMHILKYFWMEKLNVKIKSQIKELEEVEDLQEIIVEIIYEFIWEKQTEIMFKIDWKIQTLWVKHFIDHFVRILPDFKSLHLSNIKEHFTFKTIDKEK